MRRSFWILLSATLLVAFVSIKLFKDTQTNNRSASHPISVETLLEKGEWALAAQLLEKNLLLNPKNPAICLQLAILYDDYLKRTTEAIKYYEIYLSIAPENEKTPLVRQWLKTAKEKNSQNPEKVETVEDLKKQLRSQENKVDALRQEYENMKAKSHQQAITIQQLQNSVIQMEVKTREYHSQIKLAQDQKIDQDNLANELERSNSSIHELETEYTHTQNALRNATGQIEILQKERETLQNQIQASVQNIAKNNELSLTEENKQLKSTKRIYEARLIKQKATIEAIRVSNAQLKHKLQINPYPTLLKPAREMTRTYKVKRGESLRTIAILLYGDKDKWHLIYGANRQKITNPDVLTPGQILEIPQDPSR